MHKYLHPRRGRRKERQYTDELEIERCVWRGSNMCMRKVHSVL